MVQRTRITPTLVEPTVGESESGSGHAEFGATTTSDSSYPDTLPVEDDPYQTTLDHYFSLLTHLE